MTEVALLAALPPPVIKWLDDLHRFLPPDRLRPETVAALPAWIEAARADCAPANRREITKLFRMLSAALPPQFGMDEAVALPLYIRHLSDQPAKALPPTLDDLLRTMTHFPTIKHVRDAAKPYAGTLRLRLHRLELLEECEQIASKTGLPISELWRDPHRRSRCRHIESS